MMRAENHMRPGLGKVISGGQTGVDRAALDAALEVGLTIGGWCPRGRRAEDGVIPAKYPLRETTSDDYRQRTRLNVETADATLILYMGEISGGTRLTVDLCKRLKVRWTSLDLTRAADKKDWCYPFTLKGQQLAVAQPLLDGKENWTLNVAGPRASKAPGVYDAALEFLRAVFSVLKADDAETGQ